MREDLDHPEQKDPPAAIDEESGEDDASFGVVRRGWDQLVGAMREAKPSLALFLREATLIGLEGHILKLGFAGDDRFAMTQVLKNRESVERICAEQYGQQLRLEGVVLEGGESAREEKEAAPSPESDPTIRSVLDTFDGELV